ncbi:MAG: MBL fold metallo-hydrolase [Candidatus Woesearchaeota archaeon]
MTDSPSMVIKYWGVRGSIPISRDYREERTQDFRLIKKIITDGGTDILFPNDKSIQDYLENQHLSVSGGYGGDTTCIEIQARDSPLIIYDAGTGIRKLGDQLIKRLFAGQNLNPLNSDEATKRDIHIIFSHYHWDHIQGFPFFAPAFVPGDFKVNLFLYGRDEAPRTVESVLERQQLYQNFPVTLRDLPCHKKPVDLAKIEVPTVEIGKAKVSYQDITLSHPGNVFGFSIVANGKKVALASDSEHNDIPNPVIVDLARDADILYCDGQYKPNEYKGDPKSLTGALPKVGWGHSTYQWTIRNALAAGVKTVVCGHHEPKRSDEAFKDLEYEAMVFLNDQLKLPENKGKGLDFVLAYQGLEQRL